MKVGEEGLYRIDGKLVYVNPVKEFKGTMYATFKLLKHADGRLDTGGQPSDLVLWYPNGYELVARMSLEKAKSLVEYL